ncbi:hypothetical protein OSTOST_17202, partial [Ostertagia ostertagi]
ASTSLRRTTVPPICELQGTSMEAHVPSYFMTDTSFQVASSPYFLGYGSNNIYYHTTHVAAPSLYVDSTLLQTPTTPAQVSSMPLSSLFLSTHHPTSSSPTQLSTASHQPLTTSSSVPPQLTPVSFQRAISSSPAPPQLSSGALQPHTSPSAAPPRLSPIPFQGPTSSSPAPPRLSPISFQGPTSSSPAPPRLSPISFQGPTSSSPAPPRLSPNSFQGPTSTSPAPPRLSPNSHQPPLSPIRSPAPPSVTPAPSLYSATAPAHSMHRLPLTQCTKLCEDTSVKSRIPGTTRSFTFYRVYTNKNCANYTCVHCLKERRRRGEHVMGECIKKKWKTVSGLQFGAQAIKPDDEQSQSTTQ